MNFHIISNTSHLLLIETPMDFSGSLLLYLIVVPIFFLIGAFQLRAGTVFAGKKCAATPSGALFTQHTALHAYDRTQPP
jgi:hypothetical protein